MTRTNTTEQTTYMLDGTLVGDEARLLDLQRNEATSIFQMILQSRDRFIYIYIYVDIDELDDVSEDA
jgi:hypothetical protein